MHQGLVVLAQELETREAPQIGQEKACQAGQQKRQRQHPEDEFEGAASGRAPVIHGSSHSGTHCRCRVVVVMELKWCITAAI
jgi:hypothetical protein